MKWIPEKKDSLFSREKPLKVNDQESVPKKELDKGLDTTSQTMLYDEFDRYYKNKNADFKFAIGVVCFSKKASKLSSVEAVKKEINRLCSCNNNPDFSDDDRLRFKNMSKVYEDIINFRDHSSIGNETISFKELFSVLKEVHQNNINKSNEEFNSNLFDTIKKRLTNKPSQHDIIKEFLFYNTEMGNVDILIERCILDLPDLLNRFGFVYNAYTDELNESVIQILKEISSES